MLAFAIVLPASSAVGVRMAPRRSAAFVVHVVFLVVWALVMVAALFVVDAFWRGSATLR
jgi:hypothetical protein